MVTLMHTVPLPGMHLDAWRIRPSLQLTHSWEDSLPHSAKMSLSHKRHLTPIMAKRIERTSSTAGNKKETPRGAAKTTAQGALEMSHVHRLAALVIEKADLLKELAVLRGQLLPKNKKPLTPPPPLPHQGPFQRPLLMAAKRWRKMRRAANPSSLGHHILIHSHMLPNMGGLRPLLLGLCLPLYRTHRVAKMIKRPPLRSGDISLPPPPSHILTVLANLPNEWPLVKIDMILNIRQRHTTSHGVDFCTSMNDCVPLMKVPQLARLTKIRIASWNTLVQVFSEWIVSSIEPAKELTRVKELEFLFLHDN